MLFVYLNSTMHVCVSATGLTAHTSSDNIKSHARTPTAAEHATLTFGCNLVGSYYGCKFPDSHEFHQGAMKHTSQASLSGRSADNPMFSQGFSISNINCSKMLSRLR
ncbi:hypothetical protein DPEC_G00046040 [Dallia pectoralis]|uniref:Uncharacterized protein n=1 Tax=Dallia pectoralis TaxID=75939 RepID=A0ACC2HA48_DALPE|nr:hypothetical protein DPEC_G00046040 [Dallia pectoralis]